MLAKPVCGADEVPGETLLELFTTDRIAFVDHSDKGVSFRQFLTLTDGCLQMHGGQRGIGKFFNLLNNHYKVGDTFPYMRRIGRRYGIYFENANAYFNESTVLLTLEKLSGPPLCVSRSVPHYLRESWKSPPQYCASELLLGQANCDYITREVSKMASYDLTVADLAPIPLPEVAMLPVTEQTSYTAENFF